MFGHSDAEVEEYLDRLMEGPRPGWEGRLRFTWTDDDEPYTLSPLWDLVDGDAKVVDDATEEEARDAWEHAAAWTQSDLDESEREFRLADATRTRKLVTAYRAALQDLTHRYGRAQGHRVSPGVQVFFAQTGLALGMYPNQVAHRVDTAEILDRQLPKTWQEYLSGRTPWAAVPNRKGITPTIVITVPVLSLLDVTDEPARLEGVGPIVPVARPPRRWRVASEPAPWAQSRPRHASPRTHPPSTGCSLTRSPGCGSTSTEGRPCPRRISAGG